MCNEEPGHSSECFVVLDAALSGMLHITTLSSTQSALLSSPRHDEETGFQRLSGTGNQNPGSQAQIVSS